MKNMFPSVSLLGPQNPDPVAVDELDRCGIGERVAAITAGWQEREAEDEELQDHLQRTVVDLELHRRCDRAFAADPELFRAHRRRQDRLQAIQRMYRYRLDFVLAPARELLSRRAAGDEHEFLDSSIESAVEMVRRLDAEHLEALSRIHESFEAQVRPRERASVIRERSRVRDLIADSSALVITGGHVAVLLNRMRLLGVLDFCQHLPLVAWSAGAMVLSERIVVFHDHPPQGAGNAEVLEVGLGIVSGMTLLPHARRRLRLTDRERVTMFAQRFAPSRCIALDRGSRLSCEAGQWSASTATRELTGDGSVVDVAGRLASEEIPHSSVAHGRDER